MTVSVLWLFLTELWVALQCAIVVSPSWVRGITYFFRSKKASLGPQTTIRGSGYWKHPILLTVKITLNGYNVPWQTVKTRVPCSISSVSALFACIKTIFRKEKYHKMKIITGDPSIYTMDQPDCIASNSMENSIGLKG